MNDSLDKVLDIAKRLRSLAKKTNDSKVQDLVTDLNLSLADLRVELIEQRHQSDATATSTTTTAQATPEQPAQTTEPAVALATAQAPTPSSDDSEFTY